VISAEFEFPQSPLLLVALEAVGFQAGRYCPALGLHLDLKARLNTLLEIDRFLQPDRVDGFGDDSVKSDEFSQRVWDYESDGARADVFAFRDRRAALLDELFVLHIRRVRDWIFLVRFSRWGITPMIRFLMIPAASVVVIVHFQPPAVSVRTISGMVISHAAASSIIMSPSAELSV